MKFLPPSINLLIYNEKISRCRLIETLPRRAARIMPAFVPFISSCQPTSSPPSPIPISLIFTLLKQLLHNSAPAEYYILTHAAYAFFFIRFKPIDRVADSEAGGRGRHDRITIAAFYEDIFGRSVFYNDYLETRSIVFPRFLSLTKRSKVHREFKLDRNCKSVLNISLAAFEKVVSYSFNVYFELVAG